MSSALTHNARHMLVLLQQSAGPLTLPQVAGAMQLSVATTLQVLADLHDLGLVTYSGTETAKASWTLTHRGREYLSPRALRPPKKDERG